MEREQTRVAKREVFPGPRSYVGFDRRREDIWHLFQIIAAPGLSGREVAATSSAPGFGALSLGVCRPSAAEHLELSQSTGISTRLDTSLGGPLLP